ncbi:MAG: Holliday junction resolvase RuvX [Betaproteobacteria bacterium]|nr:MAG: Holliday junction resolvase RuvX [Betaproteobacteria bacterium]
MRASAAAAGTVLAFDFGTQRIGVAVGETKLGVAHPLTTIPNRGGAERVKAIEALIAEWRPVLLLVGLPTHADGTPHAMTARARGFARQLEDRFALPVAFTDERFTTRAASSALRDAATRVRDRKAVRDRIAAQLILQAYLDGRLAS